MNRAQKLKVLQEAIKGQPLQLRQLQQQKQREAVLYTDVYGTIDVFRCPPALLHMAVYGRRAGDELQACSVGDFLNYLAGEPPKPWLGKQSAIALIEATDSRYDLLPVHSIEVTKRDYKRYTLQGGTIGDLRRYFGQCARSIDKSQFSLFFDSKPPSPMPPLQP